jgi:hypothetical protein
MKTFKNFRTSIGIAACIGMSAGLSTQVFGQNFIYYLDNIGNSGYFPSGVTQNGTQATDPDSGLTTLEYNLPFTATTGDVQLEESASGPVTDIVRFEGNDVYFFSTELPSTISPSEGPLLPSSSGAESFTYIYTPPSSDSPGYSSEATYEFVVDIPEPSALPLGILGSGLLLFLSSRHRATSAISKAH